MLMCAPQTCMHFNLIFAATLDITASLFLNTQGANQQIEGSLSAPLDLTNSRASIDCFLLAFFNSAMVEVSSAHNALSL